MQYKMLIVLLPLVFMGDKAKNQEPPAAPKESVLEQLKSDTRELREATEELKQVKLIEEPAPRIIYKIKRITEIKEVPPEEMKYLLTIQGNQYEVVPLFYKGYAVIDVDSAQKQIVEQELDEAVYEDSMSKAAVEHADEQITAWQKFKNIFKRKK